MNTLTLAQANRIIAGTFSHAAEIKAPALAVVVLDAGGHLVAAQRQDHCTFLRPSIALGKAWGALGLGASSAQIGEIAAARPLLFQALSDMSAGRIVPVPGGVLVTDSRNGSPLGAVGVSGASSEIDEACALRGVAAAGLSVHGSACAPSAGDNR
jgi:uncharacterized protein GlcG (DUF336 family)